MRRLDHVLSRVAERGDPLGADLLIDHLERKLAGEPEPIVVARARSGIMQTVKERTVQQPGPPSRRRGPAVALASFVVVLIAGGSVLLWTALDDGGGEAAGVPATTVTTQAPSTTVITRTPAATVDELVEGIAAALDAKDAGALEAVIEPFISYPIYYSDGTIGLSTGSIKTFNLASDPMEGFEVLGAPVLTGSVVAVPVAVAYPQEVETGFHAARIERSGEGLLFGEGAVLYAKPGLAADPAEAAALTEAWNAAWNADDIDALLAMMSRSAMFWDGPAYEGLFTRSELKAELEDRLWIRAEYSGDPVVSGPFVAVPTRLTNENRTSDVSDGITIFEIRDGKIALAFFIQ